MTSQINQKTWYGAIVVAYRRTPQQVLVIENPARSTFALLSGAVEPADEGSQKKAAVREIKEEVGWDVGEEDLQETNLSHDFIYRLDKPGRGGDKG